jgi:2-C-methyl-D-erythritol 4-phosphate cytidylyltransferase
MARLPEVTRTVLVVRRGERKLAQDTLGRELPSATVELVEGGDSRHASEFNVLRHLEADIESGSIDVVLIHDAARPVAGPDMFLAALSTAREFGGAIPAIPVVDAVRVSGAGEVEALTDAGNLVRVQTPQAFRAAPLLEAYRAAAGQDFEGTDTSSCIEEFSDVEVRTFRGQERNIKVTYARDIAVADHLLRSPAAPAG